MFGRTVLFSGGQVDDEFVRKYLQEQHFDSVVCADSGLETAQRLGISVDAFLGDFDSVSPDVLEYYQTLQKEKQSESAFVQFPAEKDYTDTSLAVRWVLGRKPTEIVILGATGGRLDHFLANVNILLEPLKQGIDAYIVDPCNRLYLLRSPRHFEREELWGKYISFIPLTTKVTGVTLNGFAYPLIDETLTVGISRAVSNEIAEGSEQADIVFDDGILIVVESRDEP